MISTQEIVQQTLINRELSATNARNLVNAMIDADINLQKRQFVTWWEKDHSISMDLLDETVEKIEAKRNELLGLIKEAGNQGLRFNIRCAVEVEIAD